MTRPFHPQKSELPLLLDGRQNALARPMKNSPADYPNVNDFTEALHDGKFDNNPFGTVNDILWCKEAFYAYDWYESGGDKIEEPGVLYRVDEPTNRPFGISDESCACEYGHQNKEMWPRWKSGALMPKSACRLWLQVLEVKVERIRDFLNGTDYQQAVQLGTLFFDRYGLEFYESNPFVWIAEVTRIEKP